MTHGGRLYVGPGSFVRAVQLNFDCFLLSLLMGEVGQRGSITTKSGQSFDSLSPLEWCFIGVLMNAGLVFQRIQIVSARKPFL